MNRLAVILAIIAFALAVTAVLVKYFNTGDFDYTTLISGFVIPAIIVSLAYSRKSNSHS